MLFTNKKSNKPQTNKICFANTSGYTAVMCNETYNLKHCIFSFSLHNTIYVIYVNICKLPQCTISVPGIYGPYWLSSSPDWRVAALSGSPYSRGAQDPQPSWWPSAALSPVCPYFFCTGWLRIDSSYYTMSTVFLSSHVSFCNFIPYHLSTLWQL